MPAEAEVEAGRIAMAPGAVEGEVAVGEGAVQLSPAAAAAEAPVPAAKPLAAAELEPVPASTPGKAPAVPAAPTTPPTTKARTDSLLCCLAVCLPGLRGACRAVVPLHTADSALLTGRVLVLAVCANALLPLAPL